MDKETAPFQSTEPGSEEEWEYDTGARGKVLWGRIIALLIALLLAFLVGRATAGGGGISAADYSKVKRDLAAARATIADQNAAAGTQTTPSPSPSGSPSSTAAARTYVVKKGDTLRGIAIKFYGDASLADLIESANHITDPTLVHEGEQLVIPPKP